MAIATPTHAPDTALLGVEGRNRAAIAVPQLDAAIGSARGQGLAIATPTHAQDTESLGVEGRNRAAIAVPQLDAAIVSARGQGLAIATPTHAPDTALARGDGALCNRPLQK